MFSFFSSSTTASVSDSSQNDFIPTFEWQKLPKNNQISYSGLDINLTTKMAKIPSIDLQLTLSIPALDNRSIRIKVCRNDKISSLYKAIINEWPGLRGRNFFAPEYKRIRLSYNNQYLLSSQTVEDSRLYFIQKQIKVIVLDEFENEIRNGCLKKPIVLNENIQQSPLSIQKEEITVSTLNNNDKDNNDNNIINNNNNNDDDKGRVDIISRELVIIDPILDSTKTINKNINNTNITVIKKKSIKEIGDNHKAKLNNSLNICSLIEVKNNNIDNNNNNNNSNNIDNSTITNNNNNMVETKTINNNQNNVSTSLILIQESKKEIVDNTIMDNDEYPYDNNFNIIDDTMSRELLLNNNNNNKLNYNYNNNQLNNNGAVFLQPGSLDSSCNDDSFTSISSLYHPEDKVCCIIS
jgi:hypothetical protein